MRIRIALMVLLCSTLALGQMAASGNALPDQTKVRAEMKKDAESKKAKVGDEVRLEVVDDVKVADGAVLIPKKSKLTGKVTAAQPFDKKSGQPAVLAILVTSAETPSGPVAMNAIVAGNFEPARRLGGAGAPNEDYPSTNAGGMRVQSGGYSMALLDVELQPDPQLGSALRAKSKNIVLETGTKMDLLNVMPAAAPKPPVQQ